MKATLKSQNGLSHQYDIEIPAATLAKRQEVELKKIGQKVKIQGFRPGKVPMNVLKKRYGANATAEVLDSILQESFAYVVAENKIRPAGEPKIDSLEKLEEGKDLRYSITIEVLPEVPEFDFAKIALEKLVASSSDAEVQQTLDEIAKHNKNFAAISKARAAKAGDQVVFNFEGRKDGVPFDGGKAEGFKLVLGSGQFIPGFEEEMIGMKADEEKTFPITFPKEYHSKDLAGAKTEFTVKITEIQEEAESKIDDEFAQKLGLKDLADLKNNVRETMDRELEQVSAMNLRRKLFDLMDEKIKFEVPESMIARDFAQVLKQMKAETPEVADKELEIEARELAERRVRLGLLLSDIARVNKIAPTADEVRQAILSKAQQMPQQAKQIFDFYQKNPQAQEVLQGEILEDKVVDYILSKAKIAEKKVSKEALLSVDAEEGHVHDENCGHNHDNGHTHDENCDHNHEKPAKKAATKKSAAKTEASEKPKKAKK